MAYNLTASDIKTYKEAYHTDDPILIHHIYDAKYYSEYDVWHFTSNGHKLVQNIDGIQCLLTNKKLKEIIYLINISSRMYDMYIPVEIRRRLYANGNRLR